MKENGMRIRAIFIIAATIWLASGFAGQRAWAAESAPRELGFSALMDMVRLNKGKVVLINFFATWCPACKEEISELTALVRGYPAGSLAVIGVSLDHEPQAVTPFVKRFKINYPVFLASGDLAGNFGVRTIPHNVVYDTRGRLAANATGLIKEEDLKDYINILLEQKQQ